MTQICVRGTVFQEANVYKRISWSDLTCDGCSLPLQSPGSAVCNAVVEVVADMGFYRECAFHYLKVNSVLLPLATLSSMYKGCGAAVGSTLLPQQTTSQCF